MSDSFVRYLLILQELPRAPQQLDAAGLAARLERRGISVTRRTLQRDLVRLSRLVPLTCNDRSKPYGWSWCLGAVSPLLRTAPEQSEKASA